MGSADDFTEVFGMPEIFVSDLGYMEAAGPNTRFVLYTEHGIEKRLTVSIVMPTERVPAALGRVAEFLVTCGWDKIRRGSAMFIMPPVKIE